MAQSRQVRVTTKATKKASKKAVRKKTTQKASTKAGQPGKIQSSYASVAPLGINYNPPGWHLHWGNERYRGKIGLGYYQPVTWEELDEWTKDHGGMPPVNAHNFFAKSTDGYVRQGESFLMKMPQELWDRICQMKAEQSKKKLRQKVLPRLGTQEDLQALHEEIEVTGAGF